MIENYHHQHGRFETQYYGNNHQVRTKRLRESFPTITEDVVEFAIIGSVAGPFCADSDIS